RRDEGGDAVVARRGLQILAEFKAYENAAWGKGFLMVSATPLTRSSYHAGDDFARLRDARLKALGRA
ncbi:MAG: hypothetical protein AAF192_19895, partial [Pseudomonadota bacterium]